MLSDGFARCRSRGGGRDRDVAEASPFLGPGQTLILVATHVSGLQHFYKDWGCSFFEVQLQPMLGNLILLAINISKNNRFDCK